MSQNDRPSIDHSLLSPSGRMSKRARKAAMAREHDRLFPPGYWERVNHTPQPTERERDLAHAKRLREFAARGMSVRKFTKEAERLEAKQRAGGTHDKY